MRVNSRDYWKQRADYTQRQLMKKADDFIPHMERAYRDAISSMQKDINDFFQRFADNEGMTMTQARKLYTAREMKDFRMTLEEYIAKGQESGVSDKWLKELESASDLHRIDRLKALQLQLANEIESLSAYKERGLNKTLSDIYEEGYCRNIFDIQQINGVGIAFARIDKRKINQALSKPWTYDGKTFSDRIWQDKEKLKHSIEKTLTQSIIRGEAPLKTAKRIAKETNVELSSAKRLVLTESAAMSNKASMDSYKELGVDEIEFVSALDGQTCDICGAMDGKHFKTSEGAEGINLPPLHPNCRCTTVPYFNDEFTQGEMRAAKGEDGKTYYVPSDMTFEEWKKGVDSDFDFNFRKTKNKFIDVMKSHDPVNLDGLDKKYDNEVKEIKNIISNADSRIKNYTLKNIDKSMIINENAVGSAFTNKNGEIIFNIRKARNDIRGEYTSYFHELGHSLDKLTGRKSVELEKYLKNDYDKLMNFYYKKDVEEEKAKDIILDVFKEYKHKASSTADLFRGLSGRAKEKTTHDKEYWKKSNKLSSEAFAHFFEATIRNDSDKISLLSSTFPNSYRVFIELIRGNDYE